MLKRTVSGIMLTLLVISISTLAFIIQPATALQPRGYEEALVNGGFERGDLTGWCVESLSEGNVTIATANPHSGNYAAYVIGNQGLGQFFEGIPVSSIYSITYWGRTDFVHTLTVYFIYSDGMTDGFGVWGYQDSWNFFDVTSHHRTGKVLVGIRLWGWSGVQLGNTYFDDVSILLTLASPVEATQELIESIKTWNLSKGAKNCLIPRLDNVIHQLDKGNEEGAIHKLRVFTKQAEISQGKKLTTEQANYLISEAQRIIDLIKV